MLVTAASNTAVNNLAERLMKDEELELLRVCQLDRLDEKVIFCSRCTIKRQAQVLRTGS